MPIICNGRSLQLEDSYTCRPSRANDRSYANYKKYLYPTSSRLSHQGSLTGPNPTSDARAAYHRESGSRRRACSGRDTYDEVDHL